MKLVEEARGIDVARAYLQAVLGERPDVTPRRDAAAIRFLTAPEAGTLRWISRLPRGDRVIATSPAKLPGEEVGSPHDSMGRIGHVMLRAGTAAEVNRAADEAMRSVTVESATRW
ncbi:hypothetical protein [Streptomyces albospinus]|uniref:hypothetical protein n=1 Tax=Streptomyces albospinus TaxID=285515 RepID=UPI001E4C953E|nr:hypothetical protein [Streptomyces albospinus]